MIKCLIFGGTTEGRLIGEVLSSSGIKVDMSVATDYGVSVIPRDSSINVSNKRLTREEMSSLYEKEAYDFVIDATHPYATEVSKNIASSVGNIPLYRFVRKNLETEGIKYFDSIESCVSYLKEGSERIFLTTGSKDLSKFASLKERLTVRVLPSLESLSLAESIGLEGKNIICMQGPFSYEMNKVMYEASHCKYVVTKASGRNGGFMEKVKAALDLGLEVLVIGRPEELSCIKYSSYRELYKALEDRFGHKINYTNVIKVNLIGLGMSETTLTVEGREAILRSEAIFGASRMIESVSYNGMKYSYYKASDIIPVLEANREDFKEVSVLFSGDSLFFSGGSIIYKALKELDYCKPLFIPGISSLSYLGSLFAINYESAFIISLHGKPIEEWKASLQDALNRKEELIFFITSGVKDLCLIKEALGNFNYTSYVGYNMGLKDEKLYQKSIKDLDTIEGEGLYSLFLRREHE